MEKRELIERTITNHVHQAYLTSIEKIDIEDNEIEIVSKRNIMHGIEYFMDILKVFYEHYYIKEENGKIVLRGFN